MIYTDDYYRTNVFRTIKILERTQERLFTLAINLLAFGEQKELNCLFEEKVSSLVEQEHFENTNDDNLEIIQNLLRLISEKIRELQETNEITRMEIDSWEETKESREKLFLEE